MSHHHGIFSVKIVIQKRFIPLITDYLWIAMYVKNNHNVLLLLLFGIFTKTVQSWFCSQGSFNEKFLILIHPSWMKTCYYFKLLLALGQNVFCCFSSVMYPYVYLVSLYSLYLNKNSQTLNGINHQMALQHHHAVRTVPTFSLQRGIFKVLNLRKTN